MGGVEKFFEDMSFASDRNWIFHVNDSTTPFFGKVDRHAPIGFGHIWNLNVNGSLERLQRFYELASSIGKDIVFETPNPVTSQLESGMLLNL
jgi:endonuclease IV